MTDSIPRDAARSALSSELREHLRHVGRVYVEDTMNYPVTRDLAEDANFRSMITEVAVDVALQRAVPDRDLLRWAASFGDHEFVHARLKQHFIRNPAVRR